MSARLRWAAVWLAGVVAIVLAVTLGVRLARCSRAWVPGGIAGALGYPWASWCRRRAFDARRDGAQ